MFPGSHHRSVECAVRNRECSTGLKITTGRNTGNIINKSFKCLVTRTKRKSRWEYINGIFQLDLEEGNSRPFWRYIKSQKQGNAGIPAPSHMEKLVTNNIQKSEILNDQFKSVFMKDDPDRPIGPSYPPITHLSICTKGAEKLPSGLNPSEASDPDVIPCRNLKELANSIYDQSLKQGVIPKCWTQTLVSPVFKERSKRLAENYRPVSLTCITCKNLEHILCSHIHDHLDRYDILTPLNHGFRSKHSVRVSFYLLCMTSCTTAIAKSTSMSRFWNLGKRLIQYHMIDS